MPGARPGPGLAPGPALPGMANIPAGPQAPRAPPRGPPVRLRSQQSMGAVVLSPTQIEMAMMRVHHRLAATNCSVSEITSLFESASCSQQRQWLNVVNVIPLGLSRVEASAIADRLLGAEGNVPPSPSGWSVFQWCCFDQANKTFARV